MAKQGTQEVLSVAELNSRIRATLANQFSSVFVAGEISDLSRPGSGHLYFTLKDEQGQIRAVTWRSTAVNLRFAPEDGMQVICRGEIDVYGPRGTYQLIVRQMDVQGEGALQVRLRQLRDQLAREGLFSPQRKRPLPTFPRRIAIVTSPSGAALRDFLEVVRRRWNQLELLIVPTRVQGIESGGEIAASIHRVASLNPRPDVLLITRGGGSLEDLWGFNDERVVRAIYEAPMPVISAVGHEIDVTLADLVADVRALTPSEAGERIVPDAREIQHRLGQYQSRMASLLRARHQHAQARLAILAGSRVIREPHWMIRDRERRVDELQQRAAVAMGRGRELALSHIRTLAGQLNSLSPLGVLARGYSLTQTISGKVVRRGDDVQPGDSVRVRLHHGNLLAEVQQVELPGDAIEDLDDLATRG